MPMTQRDFDLVASSILHIRYKAQDDLDWGYSVIGAVVLDQLTERLADDFAAHYPLFKRRAFLEATQVHQCSGDLEERVSDDSTVGGQARLCNAKGPEWEHSDGTYEIRITSADG